MIYLYPHSGLANRIRVIVSGLHLSATVNQELRIIWKKSDALFCDFTDIFEEDEKIILDKKFWKAKILNTIENKRIVRKVIHKIFKLDFTLFDNDFPKYVWNKNGDNLDFNIMPEKIRNFYFSTCNEFFFDKKYLKHLRPISNIQKQIDRNVKEITKKTIGIHIRRTDHNISIEESPLECFINVIRKDLLLDNEINYFLATDDREVEINLKNLFPGKIFTYDKEFSRSSVKGIQDAMVELYSLAATTKIYGSYFSSFSDIASRIGDIPLEIIRK